VHQAARPVLGVCEESPYLLTGRIVEQRQKLLACHRRCRLDHVRGVVRGEEPEPRSLLVLRDTQDDGGLIWSAQGKKQLLGFASGKQQKSLDAVSLREDSPCLRHFRGRDAVFLGSCLGDRHRQSFPSRLMVFGRASRLWTTRWSHDRRG